MAEETKFELPEKFSKVIVEDEDGNEYTLRYTRKQVLAMEKAGVTAETISEHVSGMTLTGMEWVIDKFVAPAFESEQPKMKRDEIVSIWEGIGGKQEILAALIQLFMQPILALTTDPTETRAKFRLV